MKFSVAGDEFDGGSAIEVIYFWFEDEVEGVGVEEFFFPFGLVEGDGSEDAAGLGDGVGVVFLGEVELEVICFFTDFAGRSDEF